MIWLHLESLLWPPIIPSPPPAPNLHQQLNTSTNTLTWQIVVINLKMWCIVVTNTDGIGIPARQCPGSSNEQGEVC